MERKTIKIDQKIGESLVIQIGEQVIKTTLLGTENRQAELSFLAPPSINIDRKEVHQRKKQEKDLELPDGALKGRARGHNKRPKIRYLRRR